MDLNSFQILTGELEALIRNVKGRELTSQSNQSTIVRLSRRIESCDPLSVISTSTLSPYSYWRGRDGSIEIAGIGAADRLTCQDPSQLHSVFKKIDASLSRSSPSVRYFGGTRFNSRSSISEEWQEFGVAQFILPRIEVIQQGGSYYLVANLLTEQEVKPQIANLEEILAGFKSSETSNATRVLSNRFDTPSKARWNEIIREVLACLEGSDIAKKIVLSRTTKFKLNTAPKPAYLLKELLKISPLSYGFIFSPTPGIAFLGASPERLYHRRNQSLASEALAGTTGRGSNQEHDRILADDLLNSRKNRTEHRLVIESISQQLSKISLKEPTIDQTTTIRTGSVQHLYAGIRSEINPDISDYDIIEKLHPTPAVAGTPTELAQEFINQHEGYDRGWYSGPFGALGKEESEFAVAIRSALINKDSINLFVGAGIVSGSDERSEWQEIEAKMAPYLKLIGGELFDEQF